MMVFGSTLQTSIDPVHRFNRNVCPADDVVAVQWFVTTIANAISAAPTTIAMFRPIPRICARNRSFSSPYGVDRSMTNRIRGALQVTRDQAA
jgi:hypothetical protein